MRIGIFDPYLDDLGGGEKYMMTIAECLAKNHQVYVFWDNEADFEAVKKRFSLNLEGVELVNNIFSPTVGTWKRLSESNRYDAIIVLSDGSIPLVLSKKLFLHVQQPLETAETSGIINTFKLSRVNAVFYNSTFTKKYNDSIFNGVKAEVIYPPVEIYPKDVKKENVILHVGRFRVKKVKNIDDYKKQGVMIEAFKQMVDAKVKGWKFIIAASVKQEDEEAFSQLKEAAKGYPIEFAINKSNDALWELYNKAKIYWHASGYGENLEKHPEYAEHFGISTVEAMGAGAVPVVINAGGQVEIVADGKDGILWNTLDELQEKTKQLIEDELLRKTMSESAKEKAKEFSRKKFFEKVNALINSK